MGYQESLVVCKTKEDFLMLCDKLNKGKKYLDEYISICSIGRIKEDVHLCDPYAPEYSFGYIDEGSYFVWLSGERTPFQNGCNLSPKEKKIFDPVSPHWELIFVGYVENLKEKLYGIDLEKTIGVKQENDSFQLIRLPVTEPIKDEFIREIE